MQNTDVLLRELRARGFTGGYTILKDWLHPERAAAQTVAVRRFETPRGKHYGMRTIKSRRRWTGAIWAASTSMAGRTGRTEFTWNPDWRCLNVSTRNCDSFGTPFRSYGN